MKRYVDESDRDLNEQVTVQALDFQDGTFLNIYLNQFPANVCKTRVLLDGGASHNVYYSSEIPEGSVKKRVELARGTKFGDVRGEDITFLDKARTKEESDRPTFISLGRLIQHGIKLVWTKDEAYLLLPTKRTSLSPVYKNCPYANDEVLKIVKRLRKEELKRWKIRDF